jgi:hypothetical protein
MSIENKTWRAYLQILWGYRMTRRAKWVNGFTIGYKLDSIDAVNNEEGD